MHAAKYVMILRKMIGAFVSSISQIAVFPQQGMPASKLPRADIYAMSILMIGLMQTILWSYGKRLCQRMRTLLLQ